MVYPTLEEEGHKLGNARNDLAIDVHCCVLGVDLAVRRAPSGYGRMAHPVRRVA